MANLKCALCGNYINKKKRYVSRCFQGRGLPRASSIKRHLPPVLAVLVAGGKPLCPKEPCVHDGPLGFAQSCYSVLLAAWKTQVKPAAISSPPTDDLRWTAALPLGLRLSEHPSYTIVSGSCFDLLQHVPAGSVHFVCFDPPYGTTKGSPHSKTYNRPWDVQWTPSQVLQLKSAIFRCLAPGGHVAIFSANAFTQTVRNWFQGDDISWYGMVWVHDDYQVGSHPSPSHSHPAPSFVVTGLGPIYACSRPHDPTGRGSDATQMS